MFSTKVLSAKETRLGWILLYTHILLMYVRPQEILTFLKPFRLAGIASLLLTLWVIKNFSKLQLKNPAVNFTLKFGLLCILSFTWAKHTSAITLGIDWLIRFLPICLAVSLLVNDLDRYKSYLSLWCIVHFIVFLVVFKNGGRGPGDFIEDENDVALGIAMAMPILLYYSNWSDISKLKRVAFKVVFALSCVAIIATQSRGGFLGLISVVGMLWLFSKSKLKWLSIACLGIIAFGTIAINFLPEGYIEDLKGISDPNDNTRSERIETWEIAWIMYLDNFILGVGAGNFAWNVVDYQHQASWWTYDARSLQGRQTHSMYFQILADLGTVGIFLYFSFLLSTMKKLYKLQKNILRTKQKNTPSPDKRLIGLGMMARGLFISIFPYLVSGAFISVGYYPHLAMWGVLSYATIFIAHKYSQHQDPFSQIAKD